MTCFFVLWLRCSFANAYDAAQFAACLVLCAYGGILCTVAVYVLVLLRMWPLAYQHAGYRQPHLFSSLVVLSTWYHICFSTVAGRQDTHTACNLPTVNSKVPQLALSMSYPVIVNRTHVAFNAVCKQHGEQNLCKH
jgi:hypothetical protein